LSKALPLFNQGDFAGAIAAFNDVADLKTRVLGLLCVLGHPQYDVPDGDRKLAAEIQPLLEKALAESPDDPVLIEAKMSFDYFVDGIDLILERGRRDSSYVMCLMGQATLEKLQPDDPLYWKAMVYRGRALYTLDAHRWGPTSGTGKKVLEEVEKVLPQNRYVRLLLDIEWEENYDWQMTDYLADAGDAPKWAAVLRDANCLLLDLSEWWILNKQQPQGSIGGGWGDDVELVGLFGFYGSISKHISDVASEGARKLVDGAWNHSEIDPEAGFFDALGDAEHVSEFTGDTLPMMMTIAYGDPVWLERSMKTAKLTRDLWTATNDHGYRSFRSTHLGAFMVGSGKQAASSSICLRAIQPLYKVYDYNNNPMLRKLLVELADGLLDSAMATSKSKPTGIIPNAFSFPEAELGGPGTPSWFSPGEVPWGAFFTWPNYRFYQVELLIFAYGATGDEKYLEPFKLAAEYLNSHTPDPEAPEGSPEWIAANLQNHAGIEYVRLLTSEAEELDLDGARIDRDRIFFDSKKTRDTLHAHWPVKTTEALATDRVAYPGIVNPFFHMTGGGMRGGRASVGSLQSAVTYENTGRDFAAYTPVADARHLKVAIYMFHDQPSKVGFCPWLLEVGGEYDVVAGPDADNDDRIDSVDHRSSFTLETRGQPLYLQVPARRTYIVQIRQTRAGVGERVLLPDPAVGASDFAFKDRAGIITVNVHNIGSADVRNLVVSFYDGDPEKGGTGIGSALIANIPAPNDFDPRTVRVGTFWRPSKPQHTIFAVLDPDNEMREVAESNNKAHADMQFDLSQPDENRPAAQAGRGASARRR